MKKLLNIYTFELVFLLLLGLIPLLWYKPGYIGLGHDMGFPLAPVDHFLDRFYTWTDRLGPFGSNQIQVLPGLFIHGLEALLSLLGLSLISVQKITYIFWFTLPGITMYILLRYLHPETQNYPLRLSGSLFYMMNHYLLQAWTIAERTKFSVIAALPIVALLVIKVMYKKDSILKNSLLLALVLFLLNGGGGAPLLAGLVIVFTIFGLTSLFFNNEDLWKKLKRLFIFSFSTLVFWILLNTYWIYPNIISYGETWGQRLENEWGAAGAVAWSQNVSIYSSWINLFKLQGIHEWYNNPDHPYANEFLFNPFFIFLNFVLLALALIGLQSIQKANREKFFIGASFLLMLLVAIPLSAGSHAPLGIVYDFALMNIPGFVMFRSAFFKFGMIIWFAYAYLIAVGVKDFIDWSKTKLVGNYKRFIPLILLGVYVISLLIYNYPFLTGNFFNYAEGKSTMVKVPDYIFEAKRELDGNKFSTRTLYLPNADIRTEYIEYDWGYFSLVDLPYAMVRKSSITNGVLARSNETDLIVGIFSEYIKFGNSNLIKFTGADRAVVQNDFISPDYEGNPLSGIKGAFIQSKDFTFNRSLEEWDFYNYNKESLPQIYSPSAVTFVSSSGKDLDLVGNLPEALDKDAFLWSDYPRDSNNEEIFDKIVIQAGCADCPPDENYQIFFFPSKVLIPGTSFYEIGKYITKAKKHFASSPNAKIDIDLSNSATLILDLGSIQAKRHEKGVKVAVSELVNNLEEIALNLEKISDPKAKKETLKKTRYFLSFFVSYVSQWAAAAQPGPIKSDLTDLETELGRFIAEIDEEIGQPRIETDGKTYKYSLDVPQAGDYDLYLYKPFFLEDTMALSLDNKIFNAHKLNPNWYKTATVSLDSQSLLIEVPKSQDIDARPVIFAVLVKNAPDFTSPNIEFVALNQTKYLVRTKGSEHFLLGFNSRFDPNWSLREIKQDVSDYFKGDTKNFQDGKVIEYERQDNHVLTDLLFPSFGDKLYPMFELNGISSGWVLNAQDSNGTTEHVYLLEYNNQNDFYKAAGITILSLFLILCFYFSRYGKNK